MNGFMTILGILVLLLVAGGLLGLANRKHFSARWLLAAALLVLLNDALLTRFYGLLPNLVTGLERNWQGQILALAATLSFAALPIFGWRRIGLTFVQAPGSLRATLPVLALYCSFFLALALAFPGEPASGEEVAFQLTMPGLQEEIFYRGLLLFALDRAFTARRRFLGVNWGWGAILSCLLFGLAHAFSYSAGSFEVEPVYLALTAVPSLFGVWLRLRTGSLLLPIIMHNFRNAIELLV